jgi:hypothetical protein
MRRSGRLVLILLLVALGSSSLVAPASASTQDRWAASFSSLRSSLSGPAAISVTGLGRNAQNVTVGKVSPRDAWSTIKVPLSMAALRYSSSAATKGRVERALRHSDNGAAAELWAGLGGGTKAAKRVTRVLRDLGDASTTVQSKATPGRSAYGRTQWSLKNMSRFTARTACNGEAGVVRSHLARTSGARWGLKTLKRPLVKNGYGSVSGGVLVRQSAVVIGSDGKRWGVVVTVRAPSLAAGQADATRMTNWLRPRLRDVKTKGC